MTFTCWSLSCGGKEWVKLESSDRATAEYEAKWAIAHGASTAVVVNALGAVMAVRMHPNDGWLFYREGGAMAGPPQAQATGEASLDEVLGRGRHGS